MEHKEIVHLTQEYGGDWAICHAGRILHWVEILAEGKPYDKEAVWVAAHLHDWGGYPAWIQEGIEHYDRSREVAEAFLRERNCPDPFRDKVLEIIQCHHGGPAERSFESCLFTDADALDLLGVVGTLRIFCMVPRNLKGAIMAVQRFREMSLKAITFEKSKEIAQERVEETDYLLKKFDEETFGIY